MVNIMTASDLPDVLPKPAPTLKTIAFMTGLGVSTVSRALKDGPEIAADTRARVQLIARQIGYRPNRAGVRLKTGKTNVITVVLNAGEGGSGFFANFVYGISDALAGTPYHLVVTPYSLADPMAPVRYIAETGSADGVILSRTQPDDPRVRYLVDAGIPFATHGRTEMGIVHPFHDFDNEAFARTAVDILVKRNRRRLALLGPPSALTYHKHTHAGFEQALRRHGLAGISLAAIDIDATLPQVKAAVRALAEGPSRPDGLVCSAEGAALAAAAGFEELGLVLGRDVDIITKHSTSLLEMLRPHIIALPEDFREAGRETTRMVMAWIRGEDPAGLQRLATPSSHALHGCR